MSVKNILLGALLVLLIGAGVMILRPEPKDAEVAPTGGTAVSYVELVSGTQSTVLERKNYRIVSQAQLSLLWRMLDTQGTAPVVDFDNREVLAFFAGSAPTAGYAITALEITDADTRHVRVKLTQPGGSCVLAQAITAPYQIIEIPKTPGALTHDDVVETTSCL